MSSFEARLTVTKLVSKLGFRKAIFGKSLNNHCTIGRYGFQNKLLLVRGKGPRLTILTLYLVPLRSIWGNYQRPLLRRRRREIE
jgi:hypothetical protein